jgi:hypothetical protein
LAAIQRIDVKNNHLPDLKTAFVSLGAFEYDDGKVYEKMKVRYMLTF